MDINEIIRQVTEEICSKYVAHPIILLCLPIQGRS